MNRGIDTAGLKDRATPMSGTASDPALDTAEWMANFHGCAWTREAALARLPADHDGRARASLVAALSAAGLKTRTVLRKIARIDPGVLPCILFDRSGLPIVMLELSSRERKARVLEPGREDGEREVTLRELSRQTGREVMLVTLDDAQADRRLSAEPEEDRGHWFWRPMRENRGAWAQVIVAALCINILSVALPLFVMNVYDRVVPNLAFVTLWTLALGVGIALVLDFALRTVRSGVVERIGRRLDTGVSASLFRHAMALRPGDFPTGAIGAAHHIRDFDAVREFFGSASLLSLIDLLFIGVFFLVLYLIVGPLAFVPLAAVPVMLILALAAQLPLGRAAQQTQSIARRRQSVLIETLSGLETVKSLNAEPVMQREWDRASAASARIAGRGRFWSNFTANGTQTIQQFVSVIIIVWGVFLIADGQITIGALIAANILASRALAPLGTIAQTIFRAQFAWRAMQALSAFMAMPPERDTRIHSHLRVRSGHIEIKDVTFTYPGTDLPAVRGVTTTLEPGECIALLGRVGSGKSTLGRLISGLLAPQQGTILVDGYSAAQYDPAELRAGIGYLPQDPELFTGTLRENLVAGRRNATAEEIDQALFLSGMDGFVASLPKGLEQFAGERGGHLSGGQRQGLALARLLLRRPKVLFLDEPTNAMDRDMEQQVTERLRALCADGTTLILCTHRPALADLARRMMVMDKGRLVLDGPSAEVLGRLQKAAAERSGEA
jgi:ATP-binding cassette subfamily C protein LapB